jgi:hypothetical protein
VIGVFSVGLFDLRDWISAMAARPGTLLKVFVGFLLGMLSMDIARRVMELSGIERIGRAANTWEKRYSFAELRRLYLGTGWASR